MYNMKKSMGQILKRVAIRFVRKRGMTRALLPFLIPLLMVSCGTERSGASAKRMGVPPGNRRVLVPRCT